MSRATQLKKTVAGLPWRTGVWHLKKKTGAFRLRTTWDEWRQRNVVYPLLDALRRPAHGSCWRLRQARLHVRPH